jgi:hypothetical protein
VLHRHDDLFNDVEDSLEIRYDPLEFIGPPLVVASEPAQQPLEPLFK